MKFYSEKTKQLYETPEELMEAEAKLPEEKTVNKRMAKMQNVEKDTKVQLPSKKQLAAAVEAAETKVSEAKANMELSKKRAQELSNKYLQELDSIMEPAKKLLADAQKERYEAIQRFNEAYGAYQTTYTGARAADEFARAISELTNFFPGLLRL